MGMREAGIVDGVEGRRGPGPGHLLAVVVLVLAHVALFVVTYIFVALLTLGLDPCGYVVCGDEVWAHRSLAVMGYGGVALVVLGIGLTVRRLAQGRGALVVPLVGCVLQVGLTVVGIALMQLAGPV